MVVSVGRKRTTIVSLAGMPPMSPLTTTAAIIRRASSGSNCEWDSPRATCRAACASKEPRRDLDTLLKYLLNDIFFKLPHPLCPDHFGPPLLLNSHITPATQ